MVATRFGYLGVFWEQLEKGYRRSMSGFKLHVFLAGEEVEAVCRPVLDVFTIRCDSAPGWYLKGPKVRESDDCV